MRSPRFTAGQVFGAVLLFAFAAATLQAQAAPPQAQQDRKPVAELTIRGCLQPGAERTTLTDSNGTTYLLRQAQVSSQGRALVEVRGQQLSPPGRQGQAALPELRVLSMRTLSNTCPEKVTPPPPNTKPAPQSSPPAGWPSQSTVAPQPERTGPVINTQGAGGDPSPGTGNPPNQQPSSPK